MHLISRRALREFWELHPQAEQPLRSWCAVVEAAAWSSPADVKAIFRHASILANNRIVFNIGGNDYRLVVYARYDTQRFFVRFVGTHAEYDRIDATTV